MINQTAYELGSNRSCIRDLFEYGRAFLSWAEEVSKKHPELVMENCGSGGMRIDYAMLSRYHLQSMTDASNYHAIAQISAASPTAVIPEQAAIWSCPKEEDNKTNVIGHMTNSLMQRMHLSGAITTMSPESFALMTEAVKCYKQIRKYLPGSTSVRSRPSIIGISAERIAL